MSRVAGALSLKEVNPPHQSVRHKGLSLAKGVDKPSQAKYLSFTYFLHDVILDLGKCIVRKCGNLNTESLN